MLVFIIVGTVAFVLISILVGMLLVTSTNASRSVLHDQEGYSLTSRGVVSGLFSIVSVRFADSELASCAMADDYRRPAIMTLRLRAYEVPETCSFFVNEVLLKSERRLAPDCSGSCGFEEYNRQFSLGEFDYRDEHVVKVCCNSICLEKELPSLCS